MHFARVVVHVIALVVDVVCLMLVLSAHVDVHAVFVAFRSQFSVLGGILFTQLARSRHWEMVLTCQYLAQQNHLGEGSEGPSFPYRIG